MLHMYDTTSCTTRFSFGCCFLSGGAGGGIVLCEAQRNEAPQACGIAQHGYDVPVRCSARCAVSMGGPNRRQQTTLSLSLSLSRLPRAHHMHGTSVYPSRPSPSRDPCLPPARLEYMPLWKKAQGLCPATAAAAADTVTDDDSDGAGADSSRASSFTSASAGDNGTLAAGADGEPAAAAAALDSSSSGGLSRSSSRVSSAGSRSGGRRRSSGAAAAAEAAREEVESVLAARARVEELEEELSFEDIIIFRAMAEREEALRRADGGPRAGNGGGGGGNRWGIGGWVRKEYCCTPFVRLYAIFFASAVGSMCAVAWQQLGRG